MRKSWAAIPFILLMTWMTVTAAFGKNPTAIATTFGVYMTDSYQNCPDEPVKVHIWFHNGTCHEFHNRCYTNAAVDPVYLGQGFCAFKIFQASASPMAVFGKPLAAGETITLGGNQQGGLTGAESNYVVVLRAEGGV